MHASPLASPLPKTIDDLLGVVRPGARRLPPRQPGAQGIAGPDEARVAEIAIRAMLERAEVHAVLTMRDGVYEVRSRDGLLRWERLKNTDGSIAYRIVERRGTDPIGSVDPTALGSLREEVAAAGGTKRSVPHARQSTPDALRRFSQLFDASDAPDLVYLPTPGGVANSVDGAGGAHGAPGILQSRAPLVFAGPGIAANAVRELPGLAMRDVAPTIAELLGVAVLEGSGPGAIRLRGQSGRSFAGEIAAAGARAGAAGLDGIAERALLVVWDGTSTNVLADELAAGRLPNLARLQRAGTTLRHGVVSEFPSMTWPNHATMITGSEPGRHGVISNSFIDRETGRWFNPLDPADKKRLFKHSWALAPDVETLHEALDRTYGPGTRTVAMNEPAGRGADIATLEISGVGTMLGRSLGVVRGMRAIGRRVPDDAAFEHVAGWKTQRGLDRFGAAMVGALIGGRREAPRFAMLEQFLGDTMSHELGPQSDAARMALRVQDANLGHLLDELERSGRLASTLVGVIADHGSEHQEEGDPGAVARAIEQAGIAAHVDDRFVYLGITPRG